MGNEDTDKAFDQSMDLNAFSNIPHPAHSTKVPPPPPPPRHPFKSEEKGSNTNSLPPTYSSTLNDDFTNFSNDWETEIQAPIPIDNEIREKLNSNLYQPAKQMQLNDEDISIDIDSSKNIDFYMDLTMMLRKPDEPGVILPLRADLYESYLAPILMILSQIPKFTNTVLKHEFMVFPFKQNWWNREKCSENPLLVQELQRLLAFLSDESERSFASLYNLIYCYNKLVTEELESIAEFHDFIMSKILDSVTQTDASTKQPLEEVLKCVGGFEEPDKLRKDTFYNIPIMNDTVSPGLYQTIHRCFFQNNGDDYTEKVFLTSIPDVLTIVFEPGSSNLERGFKVEEIFYPQIYSYQHRDILLSIDDELQSIRLKQQELNQRIFQLRAFNGRSVHKLLVDSAKHLKAQSAKIEKFEKEEKEMQESEVNQSIDSNVCSEKDKYAAASQSIGMIGAKITESLKEASDEKRALDDRSAVLQASKYDIDQLLDANAKAEFEPWILTGVILNALQFYYREKKDNNWIGVNISETCRNFTTSRLSFDDIQDLTKRFTEHDFGDGMILMYVKKSVFYDGEFSPLNKTLREFIDQDNRKLREQSDLIKNGMILSSSSSSSSGSSRTGSLASDVLTMENHNEQHQNEEGNAESKNVHKGDLFENDNPFKDQ